MSRPLRIEYGGAFYHVMNRGANRNLIFLDEERDRAMFKNTVGEACERWKIRVHAFALMDNHYHLLVETPLPNISRAMRHIDGVYTQRFNRRYHRDGPLLRGRFKSILVHQESYFLELVRYIHLNGVEIFGRFAYDWIMNEKHESIERPELWYCFVTIGIDSKAARYFIVPSAIVAKYIRDEHQHWRKRSPDGKDTPMRLFRIGFKAEQYPIPTPTIERYEDNWEFK